jgi:hypothetical protein
MLDQQVATLTDEVTYWNQRADIEMGGAASAPHWKGTLSISTSDRINKRGYLLVQHVTRLLIPASLPTNYDMS